MTPKKHWIIAISLLVIHLLIQYVFYLKIDFSNSNGIILFLIDIFSNLGLITLFGAGLGALFALIPIEGKCYSQKLKTTFPLLISILLFLLIITYSYSVFGLKKKGYESRSPENYENIIIPKNLDCLSVHDGIFETDNTLIERYGTKQTETNKETGEKHEFDVEWINNCEYKLTPTKGPALKLKVKITEINPDNYKCYCMAEKYSGKKAVLITIRLKK